MKLYMKIAISTTIGAGLGYAWYHFFGCTSGCMISSSWINSTLYGAFMGFVFVIPTNNKLRKNRNTDKK